MFCIYVKRSAFQGFKGFEWHFEAFMNPLGGQSEARKGLRSWIER